MMLSARAPPIDLDDDDSLSSDESFMPPVLSSYAKELLSEDTQNQNQKSQETIVVKENNKRTLSHHTVNNVANGMANNMGNGMANENSSQNNEISAFTRRPRINSLTSKNSKRERERDSEATITNTTNSSSTITSTRPHNVLGASINTRTSVNSMTSMTSTGMRPNGVFIARSSFKRSTAQRSAPDHLKMTSGSFPISQTPISQPPSHSIGASLVQLSSASKETSLREKDSPSSPSQWRPSKFRFTDPRASDYSNKKQDKSQDQHAAYNPHSITSHTYTSSKLTDSDTKTPIKNHTGLNQHDKPLSQVSNNSLNQANFAPQTETWKNSSYSNLNNSHNNEQLRLASKEKENKDPSANGATTKTPVASIIPEFVPGKKDSNERPKKKPKNLLAINGTQYQRLELIGKGGSSKVYKVQTTSNNNNQKVYAVKKVTFEDVDLSVIEGFKGEISLLQRLKDETRVVKLVDYEMFDTAVYLVMECGEIDLAHVLSARLSMPLDISFVRYYAQEMLKCVAAVHEHGIVHSDLKPANFLLVKGMLKIIDFGIANVVPDYTSNIHRDTQIGTPNYMAPEALLDANGGAGSAYDPQQVKFKVGRPSDVWSCGCIIYQMLYGRPPYSSYQGSQRVLAITNPKVQVQYPREGLGNVKVPYEAIEAIKGCLIRNPYDRLTVQDVLKGSFLSPLAVDRTFIKSLIQNAIQYGSERGDNSVSSNEMDQLTSDVWDKLMLMNR